MPAAIFPIAILTFCVDAGLSLAVHRSSTADLVPFGRAAGYRRHRLGRPATALIVCMQYLHHLRLAENTHWAEPLHATPARVDDALTNGGLINSLRVEHGSGLSARPAANDSQP